MVRHSIKKDLIMLVVSNLKKAKNLPFTIRTNNCPERKPNCKKHHSEIVVTSYDRKTKKFHLKYYSMHERGIQFQYDQPVEFIEELILKFVNSRRRSMDLNYLKKFVNPDMLKKRKIMFSVRYNQHEYKILKGKASKKNLDVCTYIRQQSIR